MNTLDADSFLEKYNFLPLSIDTLTNALIADMEKGLAHDPDGSNDSASEPMIIASSAIPQNKPTDNKVIVIDAGGTNFRSCLVTFDTNGNATISDLEKTRMPAVDCELSKEDFYNAIATNIDHLKNKALRIGFCFSYAMKINEDGDGQVIRFSKEIKAPQVVGTLVGQSLSDALVRHGWQRPDKIMMLNDTTASLLAGIINSSKEKTYSSYVGFILGTGLNNAYIEYRPIAKRQQDKSNEHIVVCEGGMFTNIQQSIFDKEVDAATTEPRQSILEKMCSGAYLGTIAFHLLKHACKESLFSKSFCLQFDNITGLVPMDIDAFMNATDNTSTKLGSIVSVGTAQDKELLLHFLSLLIDRTARIVTSLLTASVLKSGKGTIPAEPVCIVCNGTTFWKTHGLYDKVQTYMYQTLTKLHHRYYELVKIENDITLGSAVAAFIGC